MIQYWNREERVLTGCDMDCSNVIARFVMEHL